MRLTDDERRMLDGDYGPGAQRSMKLLVQWGELAGPRNVAIEGLPSDITFEHGRMTVFPLLVSGPCVMCHIIGVTLEANTLEEALGEGKMRRLWQEEEN